MGIDRDEPREDEPEHHDRADTREELVLHERRGICDQSAARDRPFSECGMRMWPAAVRGTRDSAVPVDRKGSFSTVPYVCRGRVESPLRIASTLVGAAYSRPMAQTRRNRKLGRWGRETARREAPLDEVPASAVTRISLPEHTPCLPASYRSRPSPRCWPGRSSSCSGGYAAPAGSRGNGEA